MFFAWVDGKVQGGIWRESTGEAGSPRSYPSAPAPGYPGYNQVSFRVPAGVAPGPAVPVRFAYISRPGNEATIGML